MEGASLLFDVFRVDTASGCLWRSQEMLRLTPKAFAVLQYLVERPGQIAAKEELFQNIWPDTIVSDAALTVCIRELRQALEDDARTPRYIETVHRRGYRFIAPVTAAPPPVSGFKFQVSGSKSSPAPSPRHPAPYLVGRDAELAQLHGWLENAMNGERQLVFITGEAGIGKTAIVETFIARTITDSEVWLGHGQCIEQFGQGEAYLPILSAVGQLCREPGHERLLTVLQQYAPTWLVQLPAVVSREDFETLLRTTAGATRERMLREMAEALEAVTAEQPLLLVLEDLHWSDPSTLELLSFVARRCQPARLIVIGTYRPVEMLVSKHPLRAVLRELQLHQRCKTLPLTLLAEAEIASYLAQRVASPSPLQGEACPEHGRRSQGEGASLRFLSNLARLIYQRTEGNPLFMVGLVNELVARGMLGEGHEQRRWQETVEVLARDVPNNIRQFVTDQCARLLPAEQHLLEAASVAGMTFSTAAVAAALEIDVVETEERCTRLAAQQRFLRPAGIVAWPDGTLAAGYGFLHALYQQLWHERVGVSKLQQFHVRIGNRKEVAYGERAREIAAELAVHFEQGRDYRRAIHYLKLAGENAVRRSAHQEAIGLLTKGLELLKVSPETPERLQHELALQTLFGPVLMNTKGQAAPETGAAFQRAYELSQHLGESPQLFPALAGLRRFYTGQGGFHTARTLAQQMVTVAQRVRDPALLVEAHHALSNALFHLGEFVFAQAQVEQGIAVYDPWQHQSLGFVYGLDPIVQCRNFAAHVLWFLGYPEQALQKSPKALTLARELAHPHSLSYALTFAAFLHQFRREAHAVQQRAEALIALATEHGFPQLADGTILWGWALVEQGQTQEGIAQIKQGLAAHRATGGELRAWRPYFLALLAEAYGKVAQTEEGLAALAEALAVVEKGGERWWEAELYRLKGQLTLQKFQVSSSKFQVPSPQAEAEECFLKAIEIAHKQQAKSLELRAVMSLARLWQQQGKKAEARRMLSEIYNWFTEGFDTADLQEAKALLQDLV